MIAKLPDFMIIKKLNTIDRLQVLFPYADFDEKELYENELESRQEIHQTELDNMPTKYDHNGEPIINEVIGYDKWSNPIW